MISNVVKFKPGTYYAPSAVLTVSTSGITVTHGGWDVSWEFFDGTFRKFSQASISGQVTSDPGTVVVCSHVSDAVGKLEPITVVLFQGALWRFARCKECHNRGGPEITTESAYVISSEAWDGWINQTKSDVILGDTLSGKQ